MWPHPFEARASRDVHLSVRVLIASCFPSIHAGEFRGGMELGRDGRTRDELER